MRFPLTRGIMSDRVALTADECAARKVASVRKNVGEMIAAGHCDDAIKAALNSGDIALAREVREFCAPPAK